jgi:DNA-binding GntR family transcriptional regulator
MILFPHRREPPGAGIQAHSLEGVNAVLSLSDQAYRVIKRKIVTACELPPGSVINESQLKHELGMGRTPIREALQRLAREDLVTILPRRGMYVPEISITDLRDIFEAREPIEIATVRAAAERATEDEIAVMEVLAQQIPPACLAEDCYRLMDIDERFHELVAEASRSRFLADALNWLYSLSLRVWYLAVPQLGTMENAMQEHLAVVAALKERDPSAAAAAVHRHLDDFRARIRAVF